MRLEDFDFDAYVKDHCWSLSPPDDPGCCCKLPRDHDGRHHCGGCDTEWDDWDESDLTGYGDKPL